MDVSDVAETLKSDEAVEAVTAQFETKYKEQRDHGNKQAINKSRRDVERAFKNAGVADASFDSLPAAIEALQSQVEPAEGKALTDEQALKLPAVVRALNMLKTETGTLVEQARQQEREALQNQIQEFTAKQVHAKVRTEAEQVVTQLNPNFSDDPARAAKQRLKLIEDIIAQGGYQLDEAGGVQLVDKDGNLLPGKMGNPLKFADRVREYADEFYGLPTSTPRDSAAIRQSDVSRHAAPPVLEHYKGELPKTEADYLKLANDTTLSYDARKELKQQWEAGQ
ncbi:hypothetical protein [Hymenobacter lapidiphilus]|uniref:Uncharacterized protein n=1 Tax=Hymenobacter lapidiphilus TaxID=2608003 RepID=A0A7Y7PSJ6_9BACT|nr:hypothetical protein [Hymenobacter lapidiphilus]NVO33216.1 hypothetical protein [Hymenobacter lapidiphilus]